MAAPGTSLQSEEGPHPREVELSDALATDLYEVSMARLAYLDRGMTDTASSASSSETSPRIARSWSLSHQTALTSKAAPA